MYRVVVPTLNYIFWRNLRQYGTMWLTLFYPLSQRFSAFLNPRTLTQFENVLVSLDQITFIFLLIENVTRIRNFILLETTKL